MKSKFWENAFLTLLIVALIGLSTLIGLSIVKPEKILFYSLTEDGGILKIEKHLNWSINDYIYLDRAVTVPDAIKMVDSLNKTIIK